MLLFHVRASGLALSRFLCLVVTLGFSNAQLLPSPSSAPLAERTVFLHGQRSSELKNWAELLSVSPGSERIGVRYALKSSPHLHNQLFACPEAQRFVRGNHWHTCVLPRRECLAVSIGIGGDWKFEDGLVSRGCEVHAFDPTAELRAKHEKHAGAPSTLGRMKFHFLGLGNGGRQAERMRNTSNPYGHVDGALTRGLDELLSLARSGNESRRITYLKIDCEGCEWTAWPDVAHRAPSLLASVDHLLGEWHLTPTWGLRPDARQFSIMMHHLMTEHGFRIYHSYTGPGWEWLNCSVPSQLGFGWPHRHCMVNAHFISSRHGPTNTARNRGALAPPRRHPID